MKESAKCGPTETALEQFNPIKTGAYYDKLFAKMETTVSAADLQDKQALIAARDAQEAEKHRLYLESQKAYVERQNSLSENYFLGFIGALLGSLVGAVPWALVSSAGWFVAWLGYVIAIAASKGYDRMNVKATRKKIPCVVVAVVIGVFAAQIVSDIISIAREPELQGMFSLVINYYIENFGEYLSIVTPNLIVGLIFAALGGYTVLKDIKDTGDYVEYVSKQREDDRNI